MWVALRVEYDDDAGPAYALFELTPIVLDTLQRRAQTVELLNQTDPDVLCVQFSDAGLTWFDPRALDNAADLDTVLADGFAVLDDDPQITAGLWSVEANLLVSTDGTLSWSGWTHQTRVYTTSALSVSALESLLFGVEAELPDDQSMLLEYTAFSLCERTWPGRLPLAGFTE